jgi:hypothetical protein
MFEGGEVEARVPVVVGGALSPEVASLERDIDEVVSDALDILVSSIETAVPAALVSNIETAAPPPSPPNHPKNGQTARAAAEPDTVPCFVGVRRRWRRL